jgi:AraC-like DNA-binding protein
MRKWIDLWRFVLEAMDDPNIGLQFASRTTLQDTGLLGYVMMHSATLGEALDVFTRFFRLWREEPLPHFEARTRRIAVGWTSGLAPPTLERPLSDWALSGTLALLREVTGTELRPLEVHFSYSSHGLDLSLARRYFGAQLRFEQPGAELILRKGDLELPSRKANHDLAGYLRRYAEQVIESMPSGGTVTSRVEQALRQGLDKGRLALDDVASRLAMSRRTLQRRLREEGTSFGSLREAFRRHLAIDLLRDKTLAIYEIAFLLGYSETSNFYRAFRRWEGSSPRRFRAVAAES